LLQFSQGRQRKHYKHWTYLTMVSTQCVCEPNFNWISNKTTHLQHQQINYTKLKTALSSESKTPH